ncbi:MAG: hypothetical protein ACREVO_18350 [Steroidobacteraceae bacterium]
MRDWVRPSALLRASLKTPETVGTVYNDQLVLPLAVGLCDPDGIFVAVGDHTGPVSAAVLRRHPRTRVIAVCAPNRVAHYDDGMALESFLDSHLYPRHTSHYVAIPRERRLEVRAAARAFLGL